jgi:hypothetical protein
MSGRVEASAAGAWAVKRRWAIAGLLGAALVMLGAWLPWLTLYAGLQRYGGFTGLYGWALLTGGALALALSVGAMRTQHRWLEWGTTVLGLAMVAFTCWLLVGLAGMLRHGVSAMLVARAGPGLFVALLGASLVMIGPVIGLVRRRPP